MVSIDSLLGKVDETVGKVRLKSKRVTSDSDQKGDAQELFRIQADAIAGSVDEAIGRQFDKQAGRGYADTGYVPFTPGADDMGDIAFERPAGREDNQDIRGPSVNDIFPGRSKKDDPQGAGSRKPGGGPWWLPYVGPAIVGFVLLYLLQPLLETTAALAQEG